MRADEKRFTEKARSTLTNGLLEYMRAFCSTEIRATNYTLAVANLFDPCKCFS